MSSGFTGSTTRSMGRFEREVETRQKKMDRFTDDYDVPSPAFDETDIVDSIKKAGPYGQKHDDAIPEADPSFVHMAPAGKASDQEPMDALDREVQAYESRIKDIHDQFPASKTLEALSGGVDETLWSKAKDASQEAFGKIKWPFVTWWYYEHGGK